MKNRSKMRLLVAQILWALIAFDFVKGLIVQQNQPCNKDRDILLAEDPTGDKQAFLRCVGVGVGTIGFWERRFCPNDMTFDFVNQQCKTPIANQIVNIFSGQSNSLIPDHNDQHNINNNNNNNIPAFAILNGTCAKGEQCIGGTVCDLEIFRCLCPIGTITNLETLSCVQTDTYGIPSSSSNHDNGFPQAKIYPAPPQLSGGITPSYFHGNQQFGSGSQQAGQTFNSYGSGQVGGYGQASNNNNNNNYGSNQNTFGNQQPRNGFGNNNQGNYNNNNFGTNNNNQQQSSGFSNFIPKAIIDTFLPPKNNNNQNSGVFLPEPSPIEPVSILVKPGGSCASGEQCGGGSLCTNPMKLCLCPGELEDHGGQCVLPLPQSGGRNNYPTTTPPPTLLPSNIQILQTLPPVIITQPPPPQSPSTTITTTTASAQPQIIRVGIGAYCNQYAECDYDSTCILSRCQCVEPLIEHNGKCVLKLAPVEVGPGELCDNGETCGKGSVCDSVIPVCVCPAGTDLNDGVCVRIQQTYPPSPQTLPPNYPQPTSYQTYQTLPPTMTYPSSARPSPPQQPQVVVSNVVPQVYNNLGTAPPPAPPSYPTRPPTAPPTYPPTTSLSSKSNYMKIQLGGSKQAGVGVRCSLNTDCMIGAYCNGNTHPPTCQCLSTHVNVNGRCEKVIYPGQIGCEHDLQCTTAYAGTTCQNRQCVCPEGSKAIEQTCVSEFSSPGGSCNREKIANTTVWVPVCLGGAICRSSKRCECPEPLIIVGKQCVNGTKYLLEKQNLKDVKTSEKKKGAEKVITRKRRGATTVIRRSHGDSVTVKKRSLECYPDQKLCADGKGVCIQQLCQCLHNYVYSNGKCISEILPLGAFCDENVESPTCISNSTCLNGACVCDPGKQCHAKEIKRSPVNVKAYSESCNSGDVCLNGTICTEGFCGCPSGYVFEDESCTRSTGTFRSINSQCLGNDRCSGGSVCTNSICSCVDGSVEAQGRCRQRPGGRCSYGQSCAGGSVCQLGLCQCPAGKRLLNHQCTVSIAKPGESCQSGQKCINGGVCRFGICMCMAEHYMNDGKCEKQGSKHTLNKHIDTKAVGTVKQPPAHQPPRVESTTSTAKVFISHGKLIHAKPGQLCLDGEICTGKSQCRDGYCICREEEIIIDDKCVGNDKDALKVISEIKKSAPGQYCADETACTGNSVCIGNVCVCPAGSELLQNECQESHASAAIAPTQTPPSARSPGFPGQEIETRQPGSHCQLTLHCPYRTECIRGVCRCKKGETIVSGTCRKANHESLPGGHCDPKKGLDCVGESQCYYGICVCLYGLVNNGKECESPEAHMYNIPPGGECSAQALCAENSYCSSGICRCNDNFVVDVNQKCVPKSSTVPFYAYPIGRPPTMKGTKIVYGPGSPSILPHSEDGKFHQILTANQMSINVVDQETLKALLLRELGRAPILNEPCEDVCGGGAKCINSRCQCEQGYQAYDEKCFHMASYPTNSRPTVVQQQTPTFSSMPSAPSKPTLPVPSEPAWKMQGQPGRVCAPAGICFNSAVCIQNQCVCRPGYRAANGYCEIAKVPLGQTCFMNEQCNEGLCEQGRCSCSPGIDAHGHSRCPQRGAAVRPGEDCTRNQMCSYNSVCGSFSGVCECPVGMETFFQAGECRAATRPKGPACFSSANCHKFSYCDNGYCLCKSGYTPVNGNCLPPATPLTPGNSRLDLSETRIYEKEISSQNGGNPGAAIGEIVGRGSGYGVNLGTLIGKGMLSAEESGRLKSKLMLVDEQTKQQNLNAMTAAAAGVSSQLIPPNGNNPRGMNPGGYGSLPNNFGSNPRPSLNMENYQRLISGMTNNNNPRVPASNPNVQAFQKYQGGFGANVRPQIPSSQQSIKSQSWQEPSTPNPPPRQPFGQTFGTSFNNNNLPDSMAAYGPDWQKYDSQGYWSRANNTFMGFNNNNISPNPNSWPNRNIQQPSDFYGYQKTTPQFPRVQDPEYSEMTTQSEYFTTTTALPPSMFTNNFNNNQQQNFNGYGSGLPLSIINSKLPHEASSPERPFYIVNPDANAPAPQQGQLYQMNQFGQYPPYNNQIPQSNPFYPSAIPSYPNQMPMGGFSGYNGYPQFSPAAAKGSKTMDLSNPYLTKMQSPAKKNAPGMEFSMPGEFCGNGNSKCLGNSICSKGWCRCPEGIAVENGICAYPIEFQRAMPKIRRSQHSPTSETEDLAKPLQSCSNNEICGDDSICEDLKTLGKVCLCPQGTVYLDGGCVAKGTWKTTRIGGNCSESDVCENGGYCLNQTCQCQSKMRAIDGICVKISKPGESCSSGEYCINNSECSKETKSCICSMEMTLRQGYCINKHVTNVKGDKVKPKSLPGQYCDIHTECSNGSYCSSLGVCECAIGEGRVYDQCVDEALIKLPGDYCNVYADFCSKGSECSEDGICVCSNGAEPKDSECPQNSHLKIQKLGEACINNNECPKGTYCQSGECYCNLHMVKASKDRKACDLDNDCEVGLTCGEEKFCECRLADASGEFILPMPKRKAKRSSGEEEVEQQQRESFPITQDKDYSRQAAIHLPLAARKKLQKDNKIPETLILQDGIVETSCNYSNECEPNFTCFEHKCICLEPNKDCSMKVHVTKRNIPSTAEKADEKIRSPPGGSCSEEEECSGGSVCREGWCVCPDPSMIVTRGLCVQTQPRPTVPPPQTTHTQSGTNRPIQQSSLLPSARKAAPGTSCGPLDICVGGSTCIDSICLCPAGMQPNQQTARCEKPEASKTATTKAAGTSSSGTEYLTPSTRQPQRPRPRPVTVISEPYYPNERFDNRQASSSSSSSSQPTSKTPRPLSPPTRRPTVINNSNNYIVTEDLENIENGSDLTPVIGIEGDGAEEELDECAKAGLYCRGGTQCIDLTCQCPPSYILHNDQCIPPITPRKVINKRKGKPSYRGPRYANPRESCSNGEICTGGAICQGKQTCVCPADKPILRLNTCIASNEKPMQKPQLAGPGEECSSETQCTEQSICYQGMCRCQAGFIAISGKCVKLPTQNPSFPTTTTPSSAGTTKLSIIVGPNEYCGSGRQCGGGSYCFNGICKCPVGFVDNSGKCIRPATVPTTSVSIGNSAGNEFSRRNVGSDCTDDTQCGNNAICVVNKCKCKTGYKEENGECAQIEEQYIIRKYGQTCNSQRDVCSQNSKCIDGICKCSPGLTFGHLKQMCELQTLTIPTYPNPQIQNIPTQMPPVQNIPTYPNPQMPPTIQSIPTYPPIPPQTYPTLSPTVPLKYNEIITQPPRIPIPYNNLEQREIAETTTEMVNIAGKRIPLGGRCVVGYDLCPQSAHCLMGLCVCQPGKMFRDGKCFSPNEPLPISTNSNPSMPATKLEPIPFATANRPLIRHTIGESCDEPEDCLYGSACQQGICVCPISTVEQEGKCIKAAYAQGIAQPGESCENGELCSGGALCDSGMKKCICAAGHDGTRGTCIRSGSWAALPGESCRNKNTECVGGSTCVNSTCTCDGNHYAVDGYCRPLASPNINVEYLPATGLRFSSNPTRPKQRATRCNPEKCQLPTCFCSMDGRQPPGNLDPTQIPQFIVLTFDDAVNGKTSPDYKELFETPKYKNPNGCPIKATFFVSHEWTNYDEVQWIARGGHELASNSITHSNLQGASPTTWLNEMDGMRRIMAKFGNVPEEEIVGIRAPQLAPGGDKQFEMMQRSGFLYDNSISANPGQANEPFWPQTLDHKLSWPCQEDNCPKSSFPGIWEVPMNQFYGTYLSQIQTYKRSSMLRAAVELNSTVEELVNILTTNFQRSYINNKAPFVLSLNADFLQLGGQNKGLLALQQFIYNMEQNKDVYFITMKSLISWMQDPKPLNRIHEFPDLQCPLRMSSHSPDSIRTCEKPNKCIFPTPTLSSPEHQFLSCNPCPSMFPWLMNPTGNLDF